MPPTDEPVHGEDERLPEDLAEAGNYETAREGFERGLVVLSMGLSYWLMPSGGRFRLLVEAKYLEPIRRQISCYDRESLYWPPKPESYLESPSREGFATPLLWAGALVIIFLLQCSRPGDLEKVGALDAAALFDRGEAWRLGSALFLHADLGHLVSNLLGGIFVFFSVVTVLGAQRGWLLILVSSLLGNLVAASINYPGPYHSLGASTAIFGGLGLLTGRALFTVRKTDHPHRIRTVIEPLAAGLALLGLFGAGGLHTDLVAHLGGFFSGLALGFFAGRSWNSAPIPWPEH
jgi:membrane associated rhomboid family serine protease